MVELLELISSLLFVSLSFSLGTWFSQSEPLRHVVRVFVFAGSKKYTVHDGFTLSASHNSFISSLSKIIPCPLGIRFHVVSIKSDDQRRTV
jgi:hypothetical protein